MSGDREVTAFTAATEFEAELVAGLLREAGVPARVERATWSSHPTFVSVLVRSADAERAREVLEAPPEEPGEHRPGFRY